MTSEPWCDALPFVIEQRGERRDGEPIWVVVWGDGVRPASDVEVALWQLLEAQNRQEGEA